eukprot:s1476_g8.t1
MMQTPDAIKVSSIVLRLVSCVLSACVEFVVDGAKTSANRSGAAEDTGEAGSGTSGRWSLDWSPCGNRLLGVLDAPGRNIVNLWTVAEGSRPDGSQEPSIETRIAADLRADSESMLRTGAREAPTARAQLKLAPNREEPWPSSLRGYSPGSTAAPDSAESPLSPGESPIPSPASCPFGQQRRSFADRKTAAEASLDGMAGACSRLRGEDVVSVIENGELTVLGFAPSVTALDMQKEIAASLKRSSELANEILTEAVEDDAVQESASHEQTRVAKAEKRLVDKDKEVMSLRDALHAERNARSSAEAKLNELHNTLQSRDEMLHVKNEELSKLHMELHILAREHCALQLRCRQSEESRHEGVADASSELSFLRRQCRLLQEMNQQLRASGKHFMDPRAFGVQEFHSKVKAPGLTRSSRLKTRFLLNRFHGMPPKSPRRTEELAATEVLGLYPPSAAQPCALCRRTTRANA